MKLFDTILFYLSILLMMIGIHQSMMFGFAAGYWLFMFSLGLLLWYQVRKRNQKKESPKKESSKQEKTKGTDSKKGKNKI